MQSLLFSAVAAVCVLVTANAQERVSDNCLGCLCQASSQCNTTLKCEGAYCGPFRISWGYWADAGKYHLAGEQPDGPHAYANCANSIECATETIRAYMDKFQQDCNKDGVVDCTDYAYIHKLGGYGCGGAGLQESDLYYQRFLQCKARIKTD